MNATDRRAIIISSLQKTFTPVEGQTVWGWDYVDWRAMPLTFSWERRDLIVLWNLGQLHETKVNCLRWFEQVSDALLWVPEEFK